MSDWPIPDRERLALLWNTLRPDGRPEHSVQQIGKLMRRTKNAIGGAARRFGLGHRPSPIKEPKPVKIVQPKKVRPTRPVTVREDAPVMSPREPKTCAYPHGDPKKAGFHFCGKPVARGPYCQQHFAICYGGWREQDGGKL